MANAITERRTATLYYDGKNRQIARHLNGVIRFNLWDGWELIEEWANGATRSAAYLQGATGVIKSWTISNTVYYYQDKLGSTTHIANSSGQLLESYRYDLYGTPSYFDSTSQPLNSSTHNLVDLYAGERWVSELGLYDLRNRFLSSELGRFLQADPIGFKGDASNLYRYCGNDSVNFTDADGLVSTDPNLYSPLTSFGGGDWIKGSDGLSAWDWNHKPRLQAGMGDNAGGGTDNGKFYDAVKNFVGRYRPEAKTVSPSEIGRALVEDAQEAAGKTADDIRSDSRGKWGIEWASARYIKDGHLVKAGPAPGLPYRFSPHAVLPTMSKLRPFTGSHSHGPQSEKGLAPRDFASAKGQFTHGTPYISSVASSTDRGKVVYIYMAGGGSFSFRNGNFFSE